MPGDALADAIDLARRRHTAICAEDFDAYDALGEQLATVCGALADVAFDGPSLALLDELIALETASVRVVDGMASSVSERLAELSAKARTSAAYARSEWSSVNAG